MVLGDSLMENAICGQVGSVIQTLVPNGMVTLLWYSRSTSHTAWLVKGPFTLVSTQHAVPLAKQRVDAFMTDASSITVDLYGLDSSDDRNLNRMQKLLEGCSTSGVSAALALTRFEQNLVVAGLVFYWVMLGF